MKEIPGTLECLIYLVAILLFTPMGRVCSYGSYLTR